MPEREFVSETSIVDLIWRGERLRPWRWLLVVFVGLATLTRLVLMVKSAGSLAATPLSIAAILGLGLVFDLITAAFFFIPLVVLLAVLPLVWRRYRVLRAVMLAGITAWVFLMLFVAVSEWIFWDEFSTRFNFIAVDYLVYTQEIVVNIWQSYPVAWVLGGIGSLSLALVFRARHHVIAGGGPRAPWRREAAAAGTLLLLPVLAFYAVPDSLHNRFENRYANELASNGIYEFFRAFNHAELDYKSFYPSLPRAEAYQRVRAQAFKDPPVRYSADPFELTRAVDYGATPRPLNVVLISVESLSAEFMQRFGNQEGITPRLDALAKDSWFFTHFYATGTRTVRGLEALSLSVPPTPGESIVKRPHNSNLITLGSIFKDHGFDVRYVYGGYARFDNMREFFSKNGYTVVDRNAIPDADIHHETAWGVADEDLFTLALRQMDQSAAAGRHSFTHIMTTSNHRPFTYPSGRVPLTSESSGRSGAVQYTDWAIGDFIDRARQRPWFPDTVFVIVADHCASSAGMTDLPLARYHIPLIIYAPKRLPAHEDAQFASQIDVAPTILSILRMSYRAPFFGRDLATPTTQSPAVFISTYQELGFIRDGRQVDLGPQRAPVLRSATGEPSNPLAGDDELKHDAIAYYQVAADAFDRGQLRRPPNANPTVNSRLSAR